MPTLQQTIIFYTCKQYGATWFKVLIVALIGIPMGLMIWSINFSAIANNPNWFLDSGLKGVLLGFLSLGLLALFIYFHITLIISDFGLKFSLFPLFVKRKVAWDNIEKVRLVKYNPVGNFGGWGLKLGSIGKQSALAFSASGNLGLLIIRKNEKRGYLVGINNPSEIEAAFKQAGKLGLLVNEIK